MIKTFIDLDEEIGINGCYTIVKAFLKALQLKGEYLYSHSIMVGYVATSIAENLGMNDEDIICLKVCGFLHDIGKIAIRDSILKKPDELSRTEWEQIKLHPIMGYNSLYDISELRKHANIILYHHENADGSGYPYGLRFDSIPFESVIVKVADMYAAMINERAYKPRFPKKQAINLCLKEIKHLDKHYVDGIKDALNNFPPEKYKAKLIT